MARPRASPAVGLLATPIMRVLPIIMLAFLLPIAAHAECTQSDLQGGWVAMVGFERTGAWSRCDLRITSTGYSTGSCLLPNGTVVTAEPGQFQVNGDCSVTGQRENRLARGRLQADKRGIIGRVFVDDGERSFGGWFVAVKRG
jgi:hypothetical protein